MGLDYKNLVFSLLPRGRAWNREAQVLGQLVEGASKEFQQADQRALQLLFESDPRTTNELLDAWEKLLGLPDQCTPTGNLTLVERRNLVLQKLVSRGSQTKQFFVDLAKSLGYEITVNDVLEYQEFVAGGFTGGSLSNGPWIHTFGLLLPENVTRPFVAGSRAGERLATFGDDAIECLVNEQKPAHSIALFIYS